MYQGRDAHLDFRVVASNDFSDMNDHVRGLQKPMVFIMDAKCSAMAKPGSPMHQHFNVAMPKAHFRFCLQAVLGDPSLEERSGEQMWFQKGDTLLIFTGHCRANDINIRKEIAKELNEKKQSIISKRRGVVEMRLLYHNREFSATGGLRQQRVRDEVHNALPDPLENLLCITAKDSVLPNRERKYLDIPGDSRARGIANLILA